MREIEVKLLNINEEKITQKLLGLGAKQLPTVLVIEKSFDFKNRRLGKRGQLLRLRQVGNIVELAHKSGLKKEGHFKAREETETNVTDFKIMEKILYSLGLQVVWERHKKRTSFKLGPTHFEIDEYPRIPPYLEIEGSPEEIIKYVRTLGFTMQQTTPLSATRVLKRYKVTDTKLTF